MLHDLVTFLSVTLTPALAPGTTPPPPLVAVVAPTPVAPPLPPIPAVGTGSGSGSGSSATAAASTTEADAVVGKVQAFYAGVAQVTAKFDQSVENTTFGDTKTSHGKVLIQKPGKMRWDYYAEAAGKKTVKKSFISNGTYLYVVDYENKQVIKKDLRKNLLPTAITFLYGKGDLGADFTPALETGSKYGGKTDLVLRLVPKAPSAQYKTLHLVVDPSNYRVKESIIIDAAGNKNHFRFYEPNFDAPIEDKFFQFSEKSPAVKSFRVSDGDEEAAPTGPTAPTAPAPKGPIPPAATPTPAPTK